MNEVKNKYIDITGFKVYFDDLWVSFIPQTNKARSWIRDYRGKGHDWYRFMATCVDYDGGITFPYNRVNKFRTYVNVKLRKENESN